jgi:hypothetical protein
MSELIKKNGITIGEISVKKNYAENKTAIVFKVYHQGIGSEEDHFVFYEDIEKDDWFICLPESLVSQINTNRGLVIDIYAKLRARKPVSIQEFTDLLLEKHFHIFEKAQREEKKKNRFSFKAIIKKIFK